MTEPIKLKKGFSFCFENQVYRGGSAKRGTIPAKVVERLLELNKKIEADNKKNKTENKTINLEKFRHVEEADKPADEEKGDGKPSGTIGKPVRLNA